MAQTPALFYQDGDIIDHTPVAAVTAGDVVLVGTVPMIAPRDIAAGVKGSLQSTGLWKVPKTSDSFSAGDAVYWDADGDPVTGTSGTGAADASADTGNLMGFATADAASGDTYVYVQLTAAKRTTAIAGSVTADDITGSDSSLGIAGLAAAQGGAIAVTGGTSSTASNAGGAVSMTGGTGGAAGAGGAASVTGGVPASGNAAGGAGTFSGGAGSGTGNGGAVTTKGGASGTGATGNGGAWTAGGGAALSTNGVGGAASLAGGAGAGTGAGGALAVAAGAGGAGATGNGGAFTAAGGAALSTNGTGGAASLAGGVATGTGTGGAVTIIGGASAGASGTAGSVNIDPGAATGGTGGSVNICATNGTMKVGASTAECAAIKGIYMSGAVAVAVPTIADAESDQVDVDVASAFTIQPAVGDMVIAIPQEALPTDALLNGAYVSATDHVIISFGTKEGGSGVTGANKNFKFLIVDLT